MQRISVKLECCNFGYYVKVIFVVYGNYDELALVEDGESIEEMFPCND